MAMRSANEGVPQPSDPGFQELIEAYVDNALDPGTRAQVDDILVQSQEARDIHHAVLDQCAALRAMFEREAEIMAASAPPIQFIAEAGPGEGVSGAPEVAAPGGWSRSGAARRAGKAPSRGRTRTGDAREAGPGRTRSSWLPPAAFAGAAGVLIGVLVQPFLIQMAAHRPITSPPGTAVQSQTAEATPVAQKAPGWRMSAAIYQRLYAASTFRSAPVTPEAQAAGLAQLAGALDIDLGALDFPPGLTLQRAQLLSFNGKALGQIAFLDEDNRAVSLCLFARGEPGPADPAALTSSRLLDLNGVDWRTERHAFLLIGDAPDERLTRYARALARQFG